VALLMAGVGAKQVVSIDRFLTYRDPIREHQILARLLDAAPPMARERKRTSLHGENRITGDAFAIFRASLSKGPLKSSTGFGSTTSSHAPRWSTFLASMQSTPA
jgi:hypothetical protein